jgi:excinuclease ABC subunit C
MAEFAGAQAFEKAAQVRDTIFAVERIMERQVVVSADGQDRDVLGLAWDRDLAVVTVMQVRSGHLINTAYYPLDLGFKEPDEVLAAFVIQYYEKAAQIPGSVLFSHPSDDMVRAEARLNEVADHRVHFHYPVRGEKKRLADMARLNAKGEVEKILDREAEARAGLTMLQHLLGMDRLPERMECFDNSNLQGKDPVAAMVVFTGGRPDRNAYRKFIIKDIDQQDDYAYMTHVLSRRFRHDREDMPLPDLLVVDGGKGQLSMAVSVVRELGLEGMFTLAGLAKKDADKGEKADKVYLPGRSNPLNTAQSAKALFLLAQIRDEAHRSAVTFQRSRREKRGKLSALDGIPGIGPKKKKLLLTTFKGIDNIRNQSPEELAALPGITLDMARNLLQVLSK